MPALTHLDLGFPRPDAELQTPQPRYDVVASVEAGLGQLRPGMSHREFRELVRARGAAFDAAWMPIRTAARHRGAR